MDPAFSHLGRMLPETTRHLEKIGNKMLLDEEKNKAEHTKAIAAAGGMKVRF